MASKKFSSLLGLLVLVLTSQAQMSAKGGTDWKDSSLIPASRMAQHNEFLNNQYNFPAKPRSQWELGFKVGSPTINGDVASNFPNMGFGVHLRKALGYLISVRAEFFHGTATGLDWTGNYNYKNNTAWSKNGYKGFVGFSNVPQDKVFYNYKSNFSDISAQALLNLSNIRFHKAEPKLGVYSIVGIGLTLYDTKIDALNASGQKYNFNSIANGTWKTRKDTRKTLKDILDGTYETQAESKGDQDAKLSGKSARLSTTLGVGFAFKLSKKVNLAIEDRMTFIKDDLLDGQRWSFAPFADPTMTGHYDTYNFLSVGLNINIF